MRFHSLTFFEFLAATLLVYTLTPRRFRWVILLVASYYFYASWKLAYVGLLALATGIAYGTGLWMGRAADKRGRRTPAIVGAVANLLLLVCFKYVAFLFSTTDQALHAFGVLVDLPAPKLVLPVGISFYTFQLVSYEVDVYRGVCKPERHLGRFALYTAFFPKIMEGPIERSAKLLPQLADLRRPTLDGFVAGGRLMMLGLIKKVVIADRLGQTVDPLFQNGLHTFHPALILVALYGFTFQMYFDFAGYTDIARGVARMFGIELSPNFKRPFFAWSVPEFWRRYHITLMNWLRDYVFIPTTGLRAATGRLVIGTFFVFVLSGLWHGPTLPFVLWGAMHGVYMVFAVLVMPLTKRIDARVDGTRAAGVVLATRILITFHLVVLAEFVLGTPSISEAYHALVALFTGSGDQGTTGMLPPALRKGVAVHIRTSMLAFRLLSSGLLVAGFMLGELIEERATERVARWRSGFVAWPTAARWAVYYGMLVLLFLFGRWDAVGSYLYVKF